MNMRQRLVFSAVAAIHAGRRVFVMPCLFVVHAHFHGNDTNDGGQINIKECVWKYEKS